MTGFMTVTGMAVRELWISFRLLAVLGLLLAAGLPAALVPQPQVVVIGSVTVGPFGWFALPLGAATVVSAAVVAATLAGERARGSAGWIVTRAIGRQTLTTAWFTAFALLLVLGTVAASAVVWLALQPILQTDPVGFVAVVGAALAGALAALASGLLAGTLLRPVTATLVTLILVTGGFLASAVLLQPETPSPLEGFTLLARLDEVARPVADGLRAAGVGLATTAALLLLTAAAIDRADL